MSQDPCTVEYQETNGGDEYAVSQKKTKKAKNGKETAALYSDRGPRASPPPRDMCDTHSRRSLVAALERNGLLGVC